MPTLDRELTYAQEHLATAIRKIERLPHSDKRILLCSMLRNQGRVLSTIRVLARQEEKKP